MGSYRWPQGDTDKMSDASSSFDHVQPVHAASMASGNVFEGDAFDAEHVSSRYGIDPAAHCWAEITCGTPLFETMCKLLGHHADRSFAPNIENKELAVAEEMFGTDKTPKTVALSCGLGLTTLQHKTVGGDTVTVKVLRQRRGPIVATRCGPCAWESLIVFVEGGHSGKDTLQDFISKVVNVEAERTPEEYTIYRWHVEHGYWRCVATKKSRTIDSVVLPQATKDKIIGDLDSFLTRDMFDFYISHGIPYKRSYLFYGAPGAGKTSLLTAIAGKYNRNLCILQPTDPRFTDDDLAEAIREAPAKSIIVLEDVDALFDKNREAKTTKMTISFSGLLNALDGIGNPDGQIFVLTTNFREHLDAALIRNGRVDLHVEFCDATSEQMEKVFLQFYPGAGAELATSFRQKLQHELRESGLDHVSMAALQHFFIRHMRMTASDAISALPSIIEDMQANAKSDADDDTASDKTAENKIAKPSENANVTKRASGMMAENAANLPRTRAENNVVHVHIHANGEPAQ